ncbi:hypothetical protein ES703_112151 [subsurface metagenome]
MAIGDIGAVIQTYTFDATKGRYPSLVRILDDLHCLAYSGPDDDGWARSIKITAAGVISEDASNTLEFEPGNINNCRSDLRPDDVNCICSFHADNAAYLEAVIVNADGTLSQHATPSALFAAANCFNFDPIHVSGSTLAIAYDKNSGLVYVITVGVAANGEVSEAVGQGFQVHDLLSGFARIAHVAGNVFIVTYQKADGFGYARSITITPAGAIAFTASPQVAFTDQLYSYPHVIKLKDNVFVAVFQSVGEDGWAAVFEVSNAGVITVPTNNLYEFQAGNCENPRAARISDEVFGVVYRGTLDDGFLKTIKCEVNAAAVWTAIGDLEFDVADITYPIINHRSGNTYIISYSNSAGLGIMKTIGIETPSLERPHHDPLCSEKQLHRHCP